MENFKVARALSPLLFSVLITACEINVIDNSGVPTPGASTSPSATPQPTQTTSPRPSTTPTPTTSPRPSTTPTPSITPTPTPSPTPTPDTAAPSVTAFSLQSPSSNLSVPVLSLVATDNIRVTAYLLSESSVKPSATAAGWTASIPANYTFASAGTKTLFAFAKDAAGNVSAGRSATVVISIPTPDVVTGLLFEDNFDSTPAWNASGEFDRRECSPLNVGAPTMNICPAAVYPKNWSAFRSVPGTTGLNPVVSIQRLPDGTDHTTGFGQGAVIRQESVPGVNWPGDGMLVKYLGAEHKELYIQFWLKAQTGFQFDSDGDGYFKLFRVGRKYNIASSWFDFFTIGVRPAPQVVSDPKRSPTYGWRHVQSLRGYPDNIPSVYSGVCTDNTIFNGRKVCYYGTDRIEDPYDYANPLMAPTTPGQLVDGAWHRVVYRLKMNDVGVANGVLQISIDGVLRTNATQLTWIGATGSPVGFNYFALGGNGYNTFSDSPNDQWYAYDDVVVATSPIPANYVPGGR